MAGRGPAPKPDGERLRANAPERPWVSASGSGWQHGKVPSAPTGLTPAARAAWRTWFAAWFAAFWSPADLPGLRQVVRLYDQVERGEFQRSTELRLQMDTYGITPKGQQDRRWRPAMVEQPKAAEGSSEARQYGHLRSVGDSG